MTAESALVDLDLLDEMQPGPGGRRAAQLADLVRFATVWGAPGPRRTTVRCAARPGRVPCPGYLVVTTRPRPASVAWSCPVCFAEGRILGHRHGPADLSDMPAHPRGTLRIDLTYAMHAALRDFARVESDMATLVYSAQLGTNERASLDVSPHELNPLADALLSHVVHAARPQSVGPLLDVAEDLVLLSLDAQEGAAGAAAALPPPTRRVRALLAHLLAPRFGRRRLEAPAARAVPPRPGRASRGSLELRVTLRGSEPAIWRRLRVPADIELPAFHDILQTSMGWYDQHEHFFRIADDIFAPQHEEDPLGSDERKIRLFALLTAPGERLLYLYDHGDSWAHDIELERHDAERSPVPQCLAGARNSPPEDCGGLAGYATLLAALDDPGHPRYDELLDWLDATGEGDFDPEQFDAAATSRVLAQQFGGE